MLLSTKPTYIPREPLARRASGSLVVVLLMLMGLSGCHRDKYDCNICPSPLVCNPTKEHCECPENFYRVYNYYDEEWMCQGLFSHTETDSLISYNFLFNGTQFGSYRSLSSTYNQLLNIIIHFNKEKGTYTRFNVGNPVNVTGNGTNGNILSKQDSENGDSVYIHNMYFVNESAFFFEYEGKYVITPGRGRISPDKDTLDMTVYLIPGWISEKPNPGDDPISVSNAVDVRKITLLSTRVLRKY